jgi:hypothetical protein
MDVESKVHRRHDPIGVAFITDFPGLERAGKMVERLSIPGQIELNTVALPRNSAKGRLSIIADSM